jgi:predicted regulator of Ras-like GTPase activity (Roadblock/LC7/MglB family)
MSGASSWSFREEDARKIQVILNDFLRESSARTALIVDRAGQMVATVGERESMYLADIARRVILVVLFDNRTTLGLVKLRVRTAVHELNQVFTDMFSRGGADAPQVESGFLGDAEDEIDKLFGS